jgi:hypothetical protein
MEVRKHVSLRKHVVPTINLSGIDLDYFYAQAVTPCERIHLEFFADGLPHIINILTEDGYTRFQPKLETETKRNVVAKIWGESAFLYRLTDDQGSGLPHNPITASEML